MRLRVDHIGACAFEHFGVVRAALDADARNRIGQGSFWQRVGREIVGAGAQQFVQGHRPQTVCHQNNLQSAALALTDHIRNLGQARLVILVDREYDEFQFAGIVLSQKRCRFGKIEVAPGFAQFGFHIFDK